MRCDSAREPVASYLLLQSASVFFASFTAHILFNKSSVRLDTKKINANELLNDYPRTRIRETLVANNMHLKIKSACTGRKQNVFTASRLVFNKILFKTINNNN